MLQERLRTATIGLGLALLAAAAWAQGNGPGHHGGPYFDPGTIRTLSGELIGTAGDWQPWGHGNHTGGGVHFELAADDGEEYELMLGPSWLIEENGIALDAGDPVTVTGSVVAPYGPHPGTGGGHGPGGDGDDHDYVVVTVLVADGVTLRLRDNEGYPVWRGGPPWQDVAWFDPESIVTMGGTLRRELGLWSAWGHGNHTGSGMHYLFESDGGETYYAMLGPWWYLQDHAVAPERGTRLEITGSVVEPYWTHYRDHRFLVATEVVTGGIRVPLRDEHGYPLWHGTGWHYYAPDYDRSTETTLGGVVRRTRTRPYGRHRDHGYELVFDAGGRRYAVFVAPRWYVEARRFALAAGQWIEVHGSVVRDQGRRTIVLRDVTVDGRTWRFRNARGNPMWMRGAW